MSLAPSSPPAVWDRVVCGIDGTPAGLEAARQVATLVPASARLTLCAVVNPASAEAGLLIEERLTREAQDALEGAQSGVAALHDAELHLRQGPPIRLLLDELRAERATLVAVGSHGHSRAAGMLGSVASAMLHEAACSVLINHGRAHADRPPGAQVVVGFDDSGGARRALAVGRELAERLSAEMRAIVATGDAHPAGPGWPGEELPSDLAVTEDPRTAVDALVDASASARLVILGSRHLHGVPALSSVSERVAHKASCPVLVVR